MQKREKKFISNLTIETHLQDNIFMSLYTPRETITEQHVI